MRYLMYILLALGVFEVVSNAWHLGRGSVGRIGKSAKRQHGEIPGSLPDVHFLIKAIVMFAFGLLFLAAAGCFLLYDGDCGPFTTAVVVSFAAYGLAQALVYRHTPSAWMSAVVYALPAVAYFILAG